MLYISANRRISGRSLRPNLGEQAIVWWTTPEWAHELGLHHCFIYRGASMFPIFLPGDLLYVRPEVHDLKVGDVLAFWRVEQESIGVHRLVGYHAAGLITRGDNRHEVDDQYVAWPQVIGRVELRSDDERLWPVYGGRRGLWQARRRWFRNRIARGLRQTLRPFYVMARGIPLVRRVLGRLFLPRLRLVRLQTAGGPLIKITHGRRTVARWWPAQDKLLCRKPYDLFLSPEELQAAFDLADPPSPAV